MCLALRFPDRFRELKNGAEASWKPSGSEAEAGAAGVDVSAVTGLFVADYGPHGPEVVDVQVGRYWGEVRLVATKVTGDAHVPVRSPFSPETSRRGSRPPERIRDGQR